MTTALTDLSILETAALLARRELSAQDLLAATLRRIEETEPQIHAYALVMADQAHAGAALADQEIAAGTYRGPLHGMPIGVKDLFNTRDIPTEGGSRALAGFVPHEDATVVARLRRAGAVIVGKTVTHELAYGLNEPPTRTPWQRDYYPGGSSAGSGAAVAARSAFGAIGTDTGGSIREPASLNGVVGMKPTFGLVSRAGVLALSDSLDHAGPLTRTVADCAVLLQAIAGYDRADAGSIAVPPTDYSAGLDDAVRGLTVGVERAHFMGQQVWPEVRAAVERVLADLQDQGVRVVEVTIPDLDLMSTVGTTILLPDATTIHLPLVRSRGQDLEQATRVMLELGALVPATHYLTALRARTVLRDRMRAAFTTHGLDALISPTVPTTTMAMDRIFQEDASGADSMSAAFHHMVPANVTGQPAITVPCGFSSDRLPIGVQLLGRPFGEPTLLRLARAYERLHSWHTVRPPL